MAEVAGRLGVEMVTVALDFDERVMRMGFGDMEAVRALRAAGIIVRCAPGLRTALVLVDDEGYLFTPTALYLEAEPHGRQAARLVPANQLCAMMSPLPQEASTARPGARCSTARVVKLVDTGDLKSPGLLAVPVQIRLRAPLQQRPYKPQNTRK